MNIFRRRENSSRPRSMALRIIGSLLLIVTIVLLILYVFVWRPSDSDYQNAKDQVASSKKASDDLRAVLATIEHPGNIDTENALEIREASDTYQQSIQMLQKNPAFIHDPAIKSVFASQKSELEKFGVSAKNTSDSISMYLVILDSCTSFTQNLNEKDTGVYDKLSANCFKSIDDSKSSPDQLFNKQFFTSYRDETSKYIDAVIDYSSPIDTTANDARVTGSQAYAIIQALGTIDLKFNLSNPANALETLSSKITSQQKAFIR